MSLHRPEKGKGRRGGFDEVDQLSDGFDEDLKISNASRFHAASEEQNTRKRLEARYKLLEERLATKTHELEQAIDKISGLMSRKIELKEKHEMANVFHRREQSYNEELWSDLADARAAKDFFEAEAERLRSALSAKNIELGKEIHKNSMLQKDIKALNLRSDTLKPLVDIGVATRLRYLQQARQTIHKHRISEADKVVIKNGNIAAHGGNGRADAAVFMSYLVSKTEVLVETFKGLYHCKPSEYLDQNEIKMLEQMLDCEATIMGVQRVNKSNESAGLRAEHNYLLERLYNAHCDIVRLDRKSSSSQKKLQPTVNAQQQIASTGGVEEDIDSEQGDFERTDSEESGSEESDSEESDSEESDSEEDDFDEENYE